MGRGKTDSAKPRGRMTSYAIFVQTCREEHKRKHPDENVVFAEFSKKCAERWKNMSEKEKKRFQDMAARDKKRYEAEMQHYVPPRGEKGGRGKKRRRTKDPNAPKRSLSAFFWFCNDERPKLKAIHPDLGIGQIAKELGRLWSEVDAHVKRNYEAMAERDKARYERDMAAYRARKGAAEAAAPNGDEYDEDDDEEDE